MLACLSHSSAAVTHTTCYPAYSKNRPYVSDADSHEAPPTGLTPWMERAFCSPGRSAVQTSANSDSYEGQDMVSSFSDNGKPGPDSNEVNRGECYPARGRSNDRPTNLATEPGLAGINGFRTVLAEAVAEMVCGKHAGSYDRVFVFDCRGMREYEAGHIHGAVPPDRVLVTLDHLMLGRKHFSDNYKKPFALLFHCEFSQERAPAVASVWINLCDARWKSEYPGRRMPFLNLLIKSGYKTFVEGYEQLCCGMEQSKYLTQIGANKTDTQLWNRARSSSDVSELDSGNRSKLSLRCRREENGPPKTMQPTAFSLEPKSGDTDDVVTPLRGECDDSVTLRLLGYMDKQHEDVDNEKFVIYSSAALIERADDDDQWDERRRKHPCIRRRCEVLDNTDENTLFSAVYFKQIKKKQCLELPNQKLLTDACFTPNCGGLMSGCYFQQSECGCKVLKGEEVQREMMSLSSCQQLWRRLLSSLDVSRDEPCDDMELLRRAHCGIEQK